MRIFLLVVCVTFLHSPISRAIPISAADRITVDGTEWAQVDLFTNLSWSEMNAVCSGGICGNGTLNGFDMAGWVWASQSQMWDLFNIYLIDAGVPAGDLLGPSRQFLNRPYTSSWAPAFFADGWRPTRPATNPPGISTSGFVSTFGTPTAGYFAIARDAFTAAPFDHDTFQSGSTTFDVQNPFLGGWFFRSDPSTVPLPATLVLMCMGLIALVYRRRLH